MDNISMYSEGTFKLPFKLSEEELRQKQATYFENIRKLRAEDAKLDEAKADYKFQVAPIKKAVEELEAIIEAGFEEKQIKAIEVPNEDTGKIEYYDAENPDVFISDRDMTPSEKVQYHIKFAQRKRNSEVEE